MSSKTTTKKFYLTLIFSITVALALAHSAEAREVYHRDHVNLNRLIRKRAPAPQRGGGAAQDDLVPVVVGGAAPAPALSSSAVETSAATASSSATSAAASSSASTSQSASSSASSSSASSSVSSSTESSSTESSSATTTPTQAPAAEVTSEALNLTNAPQASSTSKAGPAIVTEIQSVAAPEQSSAPQAVGAAAQSTGTTLTVIIAIAASVGGVVILWTIFRKWKLGHSAKFDERLQPIDFRPTDDRDDEGIIPAHRRPSNGGSAHGHGAGRGGSDHGHGSSRLAPLPDHDFTAPAALEPGGDYADLARGPSPAPQMHETYRGYDNGVPLHNQTGYGNTGYRY